MAAFRYILLLALSLAIASAVRAEERRIALLIGNQDYPAEVGALSNTHRDVRTMEAALRDVGFETLPHFDLDEDGNSGGKESVVFERFAYALECPIGAVRAKS